MSSFARPFSLDPSGIIKPFSGSQSDVPEGWVLCDGNNGTPDLRERMVKGTTSASASPGATGGQASISYEYAQLAEHTHSGTTGVAGDHSHSYDVDGSASYTSSDYSTDVDNVHDNTSQPTTANGSHTHADVGTDYVGSRNPVDNIPAYAETLFIMKL
jgi:microcystin-dependent protein